MRTYNGTIDRYRYTIHFTQSLSARARGNEPTRYHVPIVSEYVYFTRESADTAAVERAVLMSRSLNDRISGIRIEKKRAR